MDSEQLFRIEWFALAVALGTALQVGGWLTGIGLFTGLPAYLVVGLLIAWRSPGETLVEPALACAVIAGLGFVLDNLLLSVLVVGLVPAAGYALLALVVGLVGAVAGERFLDTDA